MKKMLAVVVGAAALIAGVAAQPAPGVVHEIYAAWCAGKGEIEPPGISDDSKKNFAAPVLAGGVVSLTPYLDGILIDFNFDKAQSKIVAAPTGPPIVQIGPGLYLERFILDPNFPGFLHCAKLESLSG
ncbi:MAG: hypothetical protein HW413_1385 [Thermoleophilia bacterium]|nr:hypothetical protein [Thermoleophilia bacterium]